MTRTTHATNRRETPLRHPHWATAVFVVISALLAFYVLKPDHHTAKPVVLVNVQLACEQHIPHTDTEAVVARTYSKPTCVTVDAGKYCHNNYDPKATTAARGIGTVNEHLWDCMVDAKALPFNADAVCTDPYTSPYCKGHLLTSDEMTAGCPQDRQYHPVLRDDNQWWCMA